MAGTGPEPRLARLRALPGPVRVLVGDLAPDHLRGRYQGALGGAAGLGVAAAPAVGGTLYAWHPAAAFAVFAVGLAAGLTVMSPEFST